MIDEVRIYNVALTATQIQTDQTTPVDSPVGAGNPDRQRGEPDRGRPLLGGRHWGRHRLPGRALHRRELLDLRPDRDPTDHHLQRHQRHCKQHATATASVPPTPPATSARTPTRQRPPPRSRCRRTTAVLTFTRTQQYTAQGPGSGSVTWLVDGVAGGTAGSGTITSGGLYTPPSSVGTHTISATTGVTTASVTVYVTNDPGTFMYHNDNVRTGQNLNETVLTPSNVKLDDVREALHLSARRADPRVTALRAERRAFPGRASTTS